MKWEMKTPSAGDIVRVAVGEIYHYGIFVSDGEIIQFGLPPVDRRMLTAPDVKVLSTDVETFLCGNFLEVGVPSFFEKRKAKKPDDVVARARSRIGEGGYHILYNNCEHFVNECVFGEKKCSQVDEVRARVASIPRADVYVYEMPASVTVGDVFPQERRLEIETCKNETVRKQKYCASKALELAVRKSFFTPLTETNLRKNGNGKWECSTCFLSLSHSDTYAVAAVSNYRIGVDAERVSAIRFGETMYRKITARGERNVAPGDRNLALLWTKKESLFKMNDLPSFKPSEIDTSASDTVSYSLDGDTLLTVATPYPDTVCVYRITDIDEGKTEKINLPEEELTYVL